MSNVSTEEKRYDFIVMGAGRGRFSHQARNSWSSSREDPTTRRPSRTRAVVEFVEQIMDLE